MSNTIKVYYGTVTGNAEDLAYRVSKQLEADSLSTEVKDLGSTSVSELSDDQIAVIVVSTWGEGDPPGDAEDFCYSLYDGEAGDLSHMRYAILSLGDSAYDDFCGCGRKIDEALAKAGAQSLIPRVDCDVDYEDPFDEWLEKLREVIASA